MALSILLIFHGLKSCEFNEAQKVNEYEVNGDPTVIENAGMDGAEAYLFATYQVAIRSHEGVFVVRSLMYI